MSSRPRRTAPPPRQGINRRFPRPNYRPPRLGAPNRRVFPRRLDRPAFKRRLPKTFDSFLTLGITLGVFVILGTAFLIFENIFSTRVNPHVSVDGIPLGGVSLVDAPAYLGRKETERDRQPIVLRVGNKTYAVTNQQFHARYTLEPALQKALGVGHEDDLVARVWDQVTTMVQGRNYTIAGTHDQRAVRRYLAALDAAITIQPQPATVGVRNNQVVILHEPVPGRRLDLEPATRLLNYLIGTRSTFSVDLPVQLTGSPISHDVAQATVDQAQALLSGPTYFSIGTKIRGYELTPNQLVKLLTFTNTFNARTGKWVVAMDIDRKKLRATMAPIAALVNHPPLPAYFSVVTSPDGTQDYAVANDGSPGRTIDSDATASLILNEGPSHTVTVPLLYPQAKFDKAAALALHFDTEESKASALLMASTKERVTNIQVAARSLDNIRLNPGQTLSVTGVLTPVNTLRGYTVDLNTLTKTDVTGANGGTTQVASTLLQAAYKAGLPILSRQAYPYLTAFNGPIGYDAMVVARPAGPDLQIANDTKHQLLVLFTVDKNNQHLTAYIFNNSGVQRKVQVNDPIMTLNQDGSVDVTISRQISGDVTANQDQITSHYDALDPYP